mmetsp:Transcript_16468/g.51228  ORF Transcript_16468/g.51228 Transcript_16468/m.51228 type:complete len:446 (-) Transcript_16468:103-1440(-)
MRVVGGRCHGRVDAPTARVFGSYASRGRAARVSRPRRPFTRRAGAPLAVPGFRLVFVDRSIRPCGVQAPAFAARLRWSTCKSPGNSRTPSNRVLTPPSVCPEELLVFAARTRPETALRGCRTSFVKGTGKTSAAAMAAPPPPPVAVAHRRRSPPSQPPVATAQVISTAPPPYGVQPPPPGGPAVGQVAGIVDMGDRNLDLGGRVAKMQEELDLPEEIVRDLLSVAGADIVVVADDSGSMSMVSNYQTRSTRWTELQTTLNKLAHMLLVVDHSDGFHVQFLNDPTWHNVHTKEHLETLFYGRQPRGRTPLAERLRPILDGSWHPKGHSNETDIILLVMTDGEPSDCSFESLRTMVAQKRKNVYLTFMMCTEDDDVVDKYNKYVDHLPGVDITDDYASEKREVEGFGRSLPYYKWLAKAVLGGKMYKYDHMDEMSRRNGGGGCCTIA